MMHVAMRAMCMYGRVCAYVCSSCINVITVKRNFHLTPDLRFRRLFYYRRTVFVNLKNLDMFQINDNIYDDFMLLLKVIMISLLIIKVNWVKE